MDDMARLSANVLVGIGSGCNQFMRLIRGQELGEKY